VDSTNDGRKTAQQALQKAREAMMPLVQQMVDSFTASQDDSKKALSLISDGLRQMTQVAALQSGQTAHTLAEQGAMKMDLGNLNLQAKANAELFTTGLNQLNLSWTKIGGDKQLPAPANKIDVELYQSAAVTAFKEAADSYEKSIASLPATTSLANNVRWAYQGSAASAYLALANASPKNSNEANEANSKASALKEKAKMGSEASLYMNNVNKLKGQN
jgi:hypothetical protein